MKAVITTNRPFPSAPPGTQRFEEVGKAQQEQVTPQYSGGERAAALRQAPQWVTVTMTVTAAAVPPTPGPHRPAPPRRVPVTFPAGTQAGPAATPHCGAARGPAGLSPALPSRGAVTHGGARAPQQRPPSSTARPAH